MPVNYPSIRPESCEWGLVSNTQNTRSELNGAIQTLALPGDYWSGILTYNKLTPANARIMKSFIASLRGQAGRFYLTPPEYFRAGSGLGTPLIKGANQTGSAITTDGWSANQTGVLLAGDYVQIGAELKMVTADVNTDSGGNATINIVPPIRVSPADNSSVITDNPTCIMQLKDPNQARWQVQPTPIYAMSIAVQEVI